MLKAKVLGTGLPIVVLPGFALDAEVAAAGFEPAFAAIQPSGWQRIYLDLPGTGGSPAGEPTSEAVLTAVRETVAELLGDTPFRLAGHSYGGYLATGLARRWPERVAGLLLVCSAPRIRPDDRDLSGVLPSSPEPGWLDGVPADLREHFAAAIGRQTRAVADRVAAALAEGGPIDEAYLDALRPDGYRLDDEDGDSPESGARSRYAGPVTVLAGRRDRVAGYRDAFAALSRYPQADYTALAGSGHYLPFEQPDSFAARTLDWLMSTR
jgi:pimeloyl-ACP methyl ester carboxylesterase